MKFSKRQREIYNFIRSAVKQKGYPPSVREIGKAVGLASSSTVHGHLRRLEEKGLIRRDPTKPRAIEVLSIEDGSKAPSIIHVPLIGKVTAGAPITAVENIDEYFPLPEYMATGEKNLFMLKIDGESMINAGIFDGDRVVVRKQSEASNGDIVIAMVNDEEATCKRFFKEKDHFRLQPENETMEPILVKKLVILGKVVGLFRDIH